MAGLVFAGGPAGGVTDAGWLAGGSPALHDIRPKRAATATNVAVAVRVALVFGRGRLVGHDNSEHLPLILNIREMDCFAANGLAAEACPFRGANTPSP